MMYKWEILIKGGTFFCVVADAVGLNISLNFYVGEMGKTQTEAHIELGS